MSNKDLEAAAEMFGEVGDCVIHAIHKDVADRIISESERLEGEECEYFGSLDSLKLFDAPCYDDCVGGCGEQCWQGVDYENR